MAGIVTRLALAIGLALPVVAAGAAHAAKLSAADRAWINTCIDQRKEAKAPPAALRKYCTCMHEVVEDNQPFEITELERTYPPIHEDCWLKYRRR